MARSQPISVTQLETFVADPTISIWPAKRVGPGALVIIRSELSVSCSSLEEAGLIAKKFRWGVRMKPMPDPDGVID